MTQTVLGLLVMLGWSLGSIEVLSSAQFTCFTRTKVQVLMQLREQAILITILAGFSVDYVTHLAHAYAHNYGTNAERIIATFGEMGGPVVHGECV